MPSTRFLSGMSEIVLRGGDLDAMRDFCVHVLGPSPWRESPGIAFLEVQTAAFPGIRARALFFRDPEGNVVEVPSTVEWDRGGHSLYFRDPDGHLLELAGPGLWDFY